MSNTLYENETYRIEIVDTPVLERKDEPGPVYHVINKQTGVIEAEDRCYAQMRMFVHDFDRVVQQLNAQEGQSEVEPASGIQVASPTDLPH